MKDFRQEGGCYYYNKIFPHQNETQFNAFMRLLDNLVYGLWYSGVLKCLLASCLTQHPPPSKGMINIGEGSILRGHNILYLKIHIQSQNKNNNKNISRFEAGLQYFIQVDACSIPPRYLKCVFGILLGSKSLVLY